MTLDQGMALTTTIASVLGGMAAIATAPVSSIGSALPNVDDNQG